ncbi:Uncharacterized protein DAT39_007783 [Clarias magur]|uniref:Uncharacterized protein n=1 Tax=Clarias magur TaxID=1594786 RepID=A0A8J4U948_CLAMG|nr:Uncharacterized protein DAT39_007783 [Clarias magur]
MGHVSKRCETALIELERHAQKVKDSSFVIRRCDRVMYPHNYLRDVVTISRCAVARAGVRLLLRRSARRSTRLRRFTRRSRHQNT